MRYGCGTIIPLPRHRKRGGCTRGTRTRLHEGLYAYGSTDMVRDGIALSTLGGRRQRYRYFGYEKAGICYTFAVNADNLRHTLGADYVSGLISDR